MRGFASSTVGTRRQAEVRGWRWPWEQGSREEPASQPASEASEPVVPTEDLYPVITERPNSGGTGGGPEAVDGVVQAVHQECSGQPDDRPEVSEVTRNTGRCKTCLRADLEIIHAKRRKGQTFRSISFEHGIPMTSLIRHFRHSGIGRSSVSNEAHAPISENGRRTGPEEPPEGADPLLWELGHLRKVAQRTLARAVRTKLKLDT
jgi:hypothetical protein